MKKLKCCGCKSRFPADTMTKHPAGNFCTDDCAISYAQARSEKIRAKAKKIKVKQEKKSHSAAKRKLKDEDKTFQNKKAQRIFNSYIRLRDHRDNCISCLRWHDGQWHAGHFLSRGASPELRFCEDNCHKQCAPCNNHLSGNIVHYRNSLIRKVGVQRVDFLEGPHDPKRYTTANLKTIQKWFTRKIKRMEKDNV